MTKRELNRDVKRLRKFFHNRQETGGGFSPANEVKLKAELTRLIYADRDFSSLNADSLRTLIRLNGRFRAVPLHSFGLFIKL